MDWLDLTWLLSVGLRQRKEREREGGIRQVRDEGGK